MEASLSEEEEEEEEVVGVEVVRLWFGSWEFQCEVISFVRAYSEIDVLL